MNNLSNIFLSLQDLMTKGLYDHAYKLCLPQLNKHPDNFNLLLYAGKITYHKREYMQSISYCEKAFQINPNNTDVRAYLYANYNDTYQHKKLTKLSKLLINSPLSDNCILLAYTSSLSLCDWEQASSIEANVIQAIQYNTTNIQFLPNFLLISNGVASVTPELSATIHRRVGASMSKNTKPASLKSINKRIRIAYLSPDFHYHPVSYFMQSILAAHNRDEFEIFCYAQLNDKYDNMTQLIERTSDHFIDTSHMDNNALANHMKQQGIHIAIDLAGHTLQGRIQAFANRIAPIQISYLGYPNSTGLQTMDFHITDHFAQDLEHGTQYSEELLFMPKTFLNYGIDWNFDKKYTPPYKETGIITFASFNNSHKLNLDIIQTWSKILNQVQNSKLLLKLSNKYNIIRHNILSSFKKYDIDEKRIEFIPMAQHVGEHILDYHKVDIVLDTFPYTGTTTTCEALSQGVPVITLVGPSHANRVSYSILKNINFEETITYTQDQYIEKAVYLAHHPQSLDILRSALPTLLQHSPLRNSKEFTLDLEELYKLACRKKNIKLHLNPTTDISKHITLPKGVILCAPNDLHDFTSFILQEQGDWYEDEIHWLRLITEPHMRILDCDSKYGHYSLSLAKLITNKGSVLALSKHITHRKLLQQSISYNHFTWMQCERSDDSNIKTWIKKGVHIVLQPYKENLNHILANDCIIMHQAMTDEGLNQDTASPYIQQGFLPYRLIPSMQILIPVNKGFTPESWQRQVFFIPDSIAIKLEEKGYLIREVLDSIDLPENQDAWITSFQEKLCFKAILPLWQEEEEANNLGEEWPIVRSALSAYAMAHDKRVTAIKRYAALNASLSLLLNTNTLQSSTPRLCTVARIAYELGNYNTAIQASDMVKINIETTECFSPSEPFLTMPLNDDECDIEGKWAAWVLAQSISTPHLLRLFTCFGIETSSLTTLKENLEQLGFNSKKINRQLATLKEADKQNLNIQNNHSYTIDQAIDPEKIKDVVLIDRLSAGIWRMLHTLISDTSTIKTIELIIPRCNDFQKVVLYWKKFLSDDLLNCPHEVKLTYNKTLDPERFILSSLTNKSCLHLIQDNSYNSILEIITQQKHKYIQHHIIPRFTPQPLTPLVNETVTILLPTYNRLKLLKRAITALLEQEHQDFILIISDNNSTDGTQFFCENLIKTDTRITYHRNKTNIGSLENFYILYQMIKTELYIICSDDDLPYPKRLSAPIEAFRKYPTVGMVVGDCDIGDRDINNLQIGLLPSNSNIEQVLDPQQMLIDSISGNNMCWASCMFRKSSQQRMLLWGKKYLNLSEKDILIQEGDYFFNLLMAVCAPIIHIPERLGCYAVYEDSYSSNLLGGGWSIEIRARTLLHLLKIYKNIYNIDKPITYKVMNMSKTIQSQLDEIIHSMTESEAIQHLDNIHALKNIIQLINIEVDKKSDYT